MSAVNMSVEDFERSLDACEECPVVIERDGQPKAVLISLEAYEYFMELEVGVMQMLAEMEGEVKSAGKAKSKKVAAKKKPAAKKKVVAKKPAKKAAAKKPAAKKVAKKPVAKKAAKKAVKAKGKKKR